MSVPICDAGSDLIISPQKVARNPHAAPGCITLDKLCNRVIRLVSVGNQPDGCRVQKNNADPLLIPSLVKQGLSDVEIAARMGWTVGTLRVKCSQLKISLSRRAKRTVLSQAITIVLPETIFDRLCQHAVSMGLSTPKLGANLLEEIVRDNLYHAVLDRDELVTSAIKGLSAERNSISSSVPRC